jgi:hypothetical protein
MASTTAAAPSAAKLSAKTLKAREPRTDRTLAWLAAFVVLAIVVGLWCLSKYKIDVPPRSVEGPAGDTPVGYVLGGITVILYGVVTAYSWRHKLRVQKRGMQRTWMEVHLAFGVVAGVAAVLHSGPRLGAPLHGAFLIAWLALIGTGILGKFLSVWIPRRLTRIEDEALLVEDCADRQKAMRTEVEQLLQDADPKLKALTANVIPSKIKSPQSYGKRRMKRTDVVEEVYKAIDGDKQVAADKRDLLKRLVVCCVEDRFLGEQLRYHFLLRAWLPFHIALTTLCFPWLLIHVVIVFLF